MKAPKAHPGVAKFSSVPFVNDLPIARARHLPEVLGGTIADLDGFDFGELPSLVFGIIIVPPKSLTAGATAMFATIIPRLPDKPEENQRIV